MSAALDHLVINTRFDTDANAALFTQLGFNLTPRGYHSLGSINHLMMFTEGYLELIGLPLGATTLRQEVLDSPRGIDGLVMATADAKATHADLLQQGILVQPVQYFSRPVLLDGERHDARFATVRLVPGQMAAGRVYFCHHETPELVWRPEWQTHPNGVTAICGLTAVSEDPLVTRAQYAKLGTFGQGFHLEVIDAGTLALRFGSLLDSLPPEPQARTERFAAITLRATDLAGLARRAQQSKLPYHLEDARLVIALPSIDTLLEFVP